MSGFFRGGRLSAVGKSVLSNRTSAAMGRPAAQVVLFGITARHGRRAEERAGCF